ncbi:MAG: hypothetical protein WCP77_14040, partial [Roseococcus sp.]
TELTTPRSPEPPVELVGRIAATPLPLILDAAVADFDRAGAGLDGRPAETALAVARLEWIHGEFRPGGRLARLPNSFMFGAQRAAAEGRGILGIAPDATSDAVIAALIGASRAITRGDPAGIQSALSSPVFTGQGRPMMSRLREPGAFPDAALATVAIRDEVAQRTALGQMDRNMAFGDQSIGGSSMGQGPTVGY